MKVIHKMLLFRFIPIFLVSTLFFVLILHLVDLFAHLWGYIQNEAPLASIIRASIYYTPQSIWFALPLSLLFSSSFTLGLFNTNNELTAVLISGTPFPKFVFPLLIIAVFLTIGGYYFHEALVIPTVGEKNHLTRELLGQRVSKSNANLAVISEDSRYIYRADYYNDVQNRLTGLTIIELDSSGNFVKRIDSEWADYTSRGIWELHRTRITAWDETDVKRESSNNGISEHFLHEEYHPLFVDVSINESPGIFQRSTVSIDELKYSQAREHLDTLRRSGAPYYREALVDYYERFAFALTPLIVILISFGTTSWFKKHVILMHLLSGLCISVLYFVLRMLLTLMAKQGYLPPLFGAWSVSIAFLFFGVILFSLAKT